MTPDEKWASRYKDPKYLEGFNAGQQHSKPSEETRILISNMDKRMEKLDAQYNYLREEIGEIKGRIVDKDTMLLLLKEAQEEVLCSAEKRFAAKWAEAVVGGLVSLILVAVITAILSQVIKS